MSSYHEVKATRTFMGRLSHDADLLEELTAIATANKVELGRVEVIGAVKCAKLGYYTQDTHEYHYNEINKPMEITCCIGNVSLKDGKPIIHAHITLSDEEDRAFGGHLGPGAKIFAGEFVMQSFEGPSYNRGHDKVTDLPLWEM